MKKLRLLVALSLLGYNEAYSSHKLIYNRLGRMERLHKGSYDEKCYGRSVSVEAKRLVAGDMEQVVTRSSKKKRRWHRRFLSKVLRQGSPRKGSENRLSMKLDQEVEEQLDGVMVSSSLSPTNEQKRYTGGGSFIIRDYENLNPSMLFPGSDADNGVVGSVVIDSLPPVVSTVAHNSWDSMENKEAFTITNKKMKRKLKRRNRQKARLFKNMKATQHGDSSFQAGGQALVGRITRAWMQNFLQGLLASWMVESPQKLDVQCLPHGNVLARLCRGYLRCDARVDFEKIVFPCIRLSSGSLEARRVGLNVLAFRQRMKRVAKNRRFGKRANLGAIHDSSSHMGPHISPRYKNQFDFHANNCTFTHDDLLRSPCIRNGLQTLLVRILKNRGIEPSVCTVQVTSIDILSNGKIACSGEANTRFGTTLPFEVSTSIETSSRGHVVTFPGLEIALGPSLGLQFPIVTPTVDLDIGHNAKLRHIHIDGNKKLITLSASATITPLHTIRLSSYRQSSHSYSALCSVDVGHWLTKIGNFAT